MSERMARSDEVLYVPLMFGYSNYARRGFRPKRLSFGDAPRGRGGGIGSVLGGVGLALSARCANRDVAADLASHIASPGVQCGIYASTGGQPGHASAWESANANEQTGNFFIATRRSIEQAFVRPRVTGHRRFQPAAGELIHRFIWTEGASTDLCLDEYARLADSLLADWGN